MSSNLASLVDVRNNLLKTSFGAIDTEFKINYENKLKPYTLFAALLADNEGKIQNRHILDYQSYQHPEKELVVWLMEEILKYPLTLGWYSKGVRLQKSDGTFEGKDSDLKVIDSVCRYYNIPSIILFDKKGCTSCGWI